MSLARPSRLLFAAKRLDGYWCFFTSPQPQSLVVAAGFQMKFPGDNTFKEFCGIASGLIYFCQTQISVEEDNDPVPVRICNPSTGQYASIPLPLLEKGRRRRNFLGFDAIDKRFKVLSIAYGKGPDQILTLGNGNESWRKIYCHLKHKFPKGEGICINGVLYYFAKQIDGARMIVCFDVRSEKFEFIHKGFTRGSHFTRVINYKGKLGVITLKYYNNDDGRRHPRELCMWVKEDD